MSIDVHCVHCGGAISAPDSDAGQYTRCPACHQEVYVPNTGLSPIELAPLDDADERRRQQLRREAMQVQRRLLEERADADRRAAPTSGTPARPASQPPGRPAPRPAPEPLLSADIHHHVRAFAIAMATGRLDEAEEHARLIRREPARASDAIEQFLLDEMQPPELASMPRAVLVKVLNQLRTER